MPSITPDPTGRARRSAHTIRTALTMIILIPCVTVYSLIKDVSPEDAAERLDKWIDEITETD